MDGNKTDNEPSPNPQKHNFGVFMTLYGTSFLFVLTSNLMLIYGFYKTSRPFTIVTRLFIYLSISEDAFIFCMVFNKLVSELNGAMSYVHYIIFFAALYLIFIMSLLIFWTISFLRFLSIFKPMYRVKTRTIHKALLVQGLMSILAVTGIVLGTLTISTVDGLRALTSKISIGLYIIMIFVNLSLNMSSLIILRRSTNSKAQQNGDSVLANEMVIKRKKMALNTLLLITIVQLVCTLPAASISFLYFGLVFEYKSDSLFYIFQCLHLSNYGINSWIVILRTKNLRDFFRFKRCCFTRKHYLNNGNDMKLRNI